MSDPFAGGPPDHRDPFGPASDALRARGPLAVPDGLAEPHPARPPHHATALPASRQEVSWEALPTDAPTEAIRQSAFEPPDAYAPHWRQDADGAWAFRPPKPSSDAYAQPDAYAALDAFSPRLRMGPAAAWELGPREHSPRSQPPLDPATTHPLGPTPWTEPDPVTLRPPRVPPQRLAEDPHAPSQDDGREHRTEDHGGQLRSHWRRAAGRVGTPKPPPLPRLLHGRTAPRTGRAPRASPARSFARRAFTIRPGEFGFRVCPEGRGAESAVETHVNPDGTRLVSRDYCERCPRFGPLHHPATDERLTDYDPRCAHDAAPVLRHAEAVHRARERAEREAEAERRRRIDDGDEEARNAVAEQEAAWGREGRVRAERDDGEPRPPHDPDDPDAARAAEEWDR